MTKIIIKSSNDKRVNLDVDTDATTVVELKGLVAKELEDTPAESQRLIFAGRILKDADKLAVYNIAEGNTVHMVKSGPKKAAAATASRSAAISDDTAAPAAASTGAQPQSQAQQPQARSAGTPGQGMPDFSSLLGSMGGMGGMGGMGDLGGMTPEMLEEMYSNPMVQQMMEQMFSNPEILRSMIDSNPMIQQQLTPQMREMLANPEFMRMATNPEMMRAAAQMQSAMRRAQAPG
ncbi:hypothetical protein LPJ53_006125, partial [Coemansia erecta]